MTPRLRRRLGTVTEKGALAMKMIYISHPYTGKEKQNRKAAEEIAMELSKKYSGIVFVNPLNAMQHLKDTDISYEIVLEQCKLLLSKCDGVIMAGDWEKSKGCLAELTFAKVRKISVWNSVDEFCAEITMPNDCCGKHTNCKRCFCRKCAIRLTCWNCNDCKKSPGRKPTGFTEMGKDSCSRYRKRSV